MCYVGRKFREWPATRWGNHEYLPAPGPYLVMLLDLPPAQLDADLDALWEATDQGAKPLGCWCQVWGGLGPLPACHGGAWAALLNASRYGLVVDAGCLPAPAVVAKLRAAEARWAAWRESCQ